MLLVSSTVKPTHCVPAGTPGATADRSIGMLSDAPSAAARDVTMAAWISSDAPCTTVGVAAVQPLAEAQLAAMRCVNAGSGAGGGGGRLGGGEPMPASQSLG